MTKINILVIQSLHSKGSRKKVTFLMAVIFSLMAGPLPPPPVFKSWPIINEPKAEERYNIVPMMKDDL